MVRIKKEYLDHWDGYGLSKEDREDMEHKKDWDDFLDPDLEDELDVLAGKKKVRLTGKYSEKRYIP